MTEQDAIRMQAAEKVHKMTLADIEKELGYKIELKED